MEDNCWGGKRLVGFYCARARRVATVCFCAGGGLEKRDGRWGGETQTRI